MAKKRISRRKQKRNRKVEVETTHVPLCALGAVIQEKKLFEPIHRIVDLPQKTVLYRPTDKLIFAMLGIMAGAESVYELNTVLRPHQPLLASFGYETCADQSVIQQSIDAATEVNVQQFEVAIKEIWEQHSRIRLEMPSQLADHPVTIDLDLSPLPASKGAEESKKGYVANQKNQYGRQLARVLIPSTSEIVTQSLYPGNTVSCAVFKEMVYKMEDALHLNAQAKRQSIKLRLDAGFGTDDNLNFALWRGYHLLAKIYSTQRARKLAKSVKAWVTIPSEAGNTQRQAGFVTQPHRYGRKTVQVAVRTQTQKGTYTYSVLVTTRLDATLAQVVTDYDQRGGVPESNFCQDYQGLSLRKRRKGGFVAQQMLVLLSQLAHNLMVWTKGWFSDALEESLFRGEEPPDQNETTSILLAIQTIEERGQKRFLRQILSLKGKVVLKGQKVEQIGLNPLYPLINRIKTALEALLKPYKIWVSLDES
jgi:hypothetical protein